MDPLLSIALIVMVLLTLALIIPMDLLLMGINLLLAREQEEVKVPGFALVWSGSVQATLSLILFLSAEKF